MTSHGVVTDIEKVDYSTKCCCKTTDGVYYEVPKQYFIRNKSLAEKRFSRPEPFNVPFPSSVFDTVLIQLEKASILSSAAATVDTELSGGDSAQKPQWMKDLDKRQHKFLDDCLGRTKWGGRGVCFYEEKLPKENDVVWVNVTQVNDTSAVVKLLEYGNHEGIIPYTEVTRIRIRSIGKVIKEGRNEAAQVIRIDKEKGYIDLSKKQVTQNEAKECEERYKKGNDVRSVVCDVAEKCDIAPEQAMEMIAYPLYRRQPGKHAWDWLYELNCTGDIEGILGPLNLPEKAQKVLMEALQNRIRKEVATIHAEIEMTCFECDGVNALRDVLLLGRNFKAEEEPHIPIAVNIVGPPRYGLRARTEEVDLGISRMREAIDTMRIEIAKRGGLLTVAQEPYALGKEQRKEERNGDLDSDDDETD